MAGEGKAMNQVYEIARKDADTQLVQMQGQLDAAEADFQALGFLQKIAHDRAYDRLLKYALFYKVQETKQHKKAGMTWEEFCKKAGESHRNVNRNLKDLRPIYEKFQDSLSCFLGMPLNKIKYLGCSFRDNLSQNENGVLSIGDAKVELKPENSEDIEAAVDALIESHKKEKAALKKQVKQYKTKTDKVVAEETKGLAAERDALVKEVSRLKEFDPADKDITWAEEHLTGLVDLAAQFEVGVRRMVIDERLHDAMEVQARCQVLIDTMVRQARGLQREWDAEFNVDEE